MTGIRRRLMATAVAAVLCVAAAACGDPPTTPTPPVTQPTPPPTPPAPPAPPPGPPPTLGVGKILAFGDSMTEGVTSASLTWAFRLDAGLSRSYPFKLQSLSSARYTAQTIQVFNAGKAGELAASARSRFTDMLSQARPDLVLLLEGANDFNSPFAPGEGINARISTTVSALEDLVRDAGFRGLPVMVATLPPQRAGFPKAGAAAYLDRVNDAIKTMASRKGAQLVDLGGQMTAADIGQDGLHPTEAGYQHMAEIWLEAIKRYEK